MWYALSRRAKLYGLLILLAIIIMELAFMAALRATGKDRLSTKFLKIREESKRLLGTGLTLRATLLRTRTGSRKNTKPGESITNTDDL